MANDRGGFRLDRAQAGSPLVIAFGIDETLLDAAAEPSGLAVGRIFLYDRARDGFYGGVAGLGDTIEGAVSALRSIINELSPDRVITIGRGIGGHAALVYGVLLGAGRIVAIEPFAHLVEEVLEAYNDRRWPRELDRMPDPALARRFEVTGLIDREGYRGHAHILLGTRRIDDHEEAVHLSSIHAHWLARSSRVTLHPFTDAAPGLPDGPGCHEAASHRLSHFLFGDIPPPTPPAGRVISARNRHLLLYDAKLTICKVDERDPLNRTGGPVTYASAGEVDATMTRRMSDELRRWIAENLLIDASPDDLATALLPHGISRRETLKEVELARFHPYFLAARRPLNRISKRDWLIATYRKLNRLRRRSPRIERRDRLSRDDFLKHYFSTGRPVVMTGMMDDWPALESWGLAELSRRFGDRDVELRVDRAAVPADRGGPAPVARLSDFIAGFGDAGPPPPSSLIAGEGSSNRESLSELWDDIGPSFHEWEVLDLAGGTFWLGPAGSSPPPPDERTATLVAQVVGRVRARVVPWWDLFLMEEAMRTSSRPEDVLTAASHLTPLDRPEVLEFTLDPGEWLFLPTGCSSRFECPGPAAMVSFDRFAFDDRRGGTIRPMESP